MQGNHQKEALGNFLVGEKIIENYGSRGIPMLPVLHSAPAEVPTQQPSGSPEPDSLQYPAPCLRSLILTTHGGVYATSEPSDPVPFAILSKVHVYLILLLFRRFPHRNEELGVADDKNREHRTFKNFSPGTVTGVIIQLKIVPGACFSEIHSVYMLPRRASGGRPGSRNGCNCVQHSPSGSPVHGCSHRRCQGSHGSV